MSKGRANSLPGHTCGPEGYYYENCEGCMYEAEDVERLGRTPVWATAEYLPPSGTRMTPARSKAEYMREWRARNPTGRPPGRPPVQPCGTLAAYRRHLRRGETPCGECRAANAEHSRRHRKDH